MITRRRVLRAMSAIPFLGAIPAVARAKVPSRGVMVDIIDFCTEVDRQLESVSVARLCLARVPDRVDGRWDSQDAGLVTYRDKAGEAFPHRPHVVTHLRHTVELDGGVLESAAYVQAVSSLALQEERAFRSLLVAPIELDSLDLEPEARSAKDYRGLRRIQYEIEKRWRPADKLFVSDADFPVLRERWGSAFVPKGEDDFKSSGLRGTVLGMAVCTRAPLIAEPFLGPGEALVTTVPQWTGMMYAEPLRVGSFTADKSTGDRTREDWGATVGMCADLHGAVLARFQR